MNPETDIKDEEEELKDYGDELESGDTEETEDEDKNPVTGQPRDKDGKFKSAEDTEGEESEEPEEDSEEEEDEDVEGGDKPENFPVRLNKMKAQRDQEREARLAAERELEALRTGKKSQEQDKDTPKDTVDEINASLDTLYEQVEDARADGDAKLAAKLQRQIDEANRKISTIEAERVATRVTQATTEEQRFNALVDALETSVPSLDPNSDDFDQQAVKDLEELVGGYRATGMPISKALHKAVKLLHKVDLLAPPAKSSSPEAKGDEKPEAGKKPPAKKPDIKKSVDTQKKQPPDASKRGTDNDNQQIDVAGLSEDEFARLPESVKAKYRGDEF